MTPDQEAHLEAIKDEFDRLYDAKYRLGQAEHGGCVWRKPGLVGLAIDEALDLFGYLYSLRCQLREARALLREGKSAEALNVLEVGNPEGVREEGD
jgi:hypothetical protein